MMKINRAIDWDAIIGRGGKIDNADYRVYKCAECGRFALYDEEICFIYLDPERLKMTEGRLYGITDATLPCPGCHHTESFEEAADGDLAAIEASEWSFVFCK